MSSLPIPYVIERHSRGERSYDLFSRLLLDRILFLGTEVTDDVANLIIAQLLFLESDAPATEIHLYINSPGGNVQSGLAIYDTMQHLSSPVATTCVGLAASMGAFLLAAGTPGRRSALPNARIMMHQPWSPGTKGSAADIEIAAKEVVYLRERMFAIMGRLTRQPLERIEREFDRDRYMSAEEAMRYGIVDIVISSDAKALAPGAPEQDRSPGSG